MDNKFDVVVIGGGPAGLTAALYAGRANKKTVFIEKSAPGGKMVTTNLIENWTGDISVNGADLSMRMFEHAKKESSYKYGDVQSIETINSHEHKVHLASGETLTAESIIIATGTIERVPEDVKGIKEYFGKGVSYCAICDGPIFKNKIVSVIGGGNSAAEESVYLSSIAKEVHIFVRKPEMRADKALVEDLAAKDNVIIHYNSKITEVSGDGVVEKITTLEDGTVKELEVSALFPYIGLDAVTEFVKELGITDENGYIVTNENMETKVEGIFAVGDVRKKMIRQISTAVADGTIAGKLIANR